MLSSSRRKQIKDPLPAVEATKTESNDGLEILLWLRQHLFLELFFTQDM